MSTGVGPRYHAVDTEMQEYRQNPHDAIAGAPAASTQQKPTVFTYISPGNPEHGYEHGMSSDTDPYPSSGAGSPHIGLQTRFSFLPQRGQRKLGHNYRPLKQFRKNGARLLGRWVISVVLCALIAVLLKYHEDHGILSQFEKRIFNGLFLGLTLFLGMNIVKGFKAMADMMKWRILASSKWSAQEMDLILSISSYQKAVKLLIMWKGRPFRLFAMTNWIGLGIGAQVAVAMLGLTFNNESEDAMFAVRGRVNATRLDHYFPDNGLMDVPMAWQEDYIAHLYGDMIYASITKLSLGTRASSVKGNFTTIGDTNIVPTSDRKTFQETGSTGWNYTYSDWTTLPGQDSPRGYTTNRTVTVTALCEWAPIVSGQNGTAPEFKIQYKNGSSLTVDWLHNIGDEGTTYMTPSIQKCGERCTTVHVFQFVSGTPDHSPPKEFGDYYQCNVDVSRVSNALLPIHNLTDYTAARVAGAIGLNGFTSTNPDGYSYQSVLYNNATAWGMRIEKSPEHMETLIGLHTIGSLANMDKYNPRKEVEGLRIKVGVRLLVVWHYVWAIFAIILGGHAMLAIFVVFRANSVLCKSDSPLATARLLRPIVDRLGSSGCAASGEEIAASLVTKMTYGVRSDRSIHHVDIGDDLEVLKKFPAGYYD